MNTRTDSGIAELAVAAYNELRQTRKARREMKAPELFEEIFGHPPHLTGANGAVSSVDGIVLLLGGSEDFFSLVKEWQIDHHESCSPQRITSYADLGKALEESPYHHVGGQAPFE